MEVNKAAIAHRISYTDENSRALARKSLSLAVDRRSDYRVGPEDVLEISIFEWELKDETRTVDVRLAETGVISLPVVGEIQIGGLTVGQVRSLLEKRLVEDEILRNPRVSVVVKEFRSKRVAVVGAVHEPGVYTLRQNVTTLLSVLTLAGGVTARAGQVLYVIRTPAEEPATAQWSVAPEREVIAVDLYELLEQGRVDLNVVLQNGDVINVPEAKKFYVVGFVRRPDGFPLTRPTTVLEAIALAGGLQERQASPRRCLLKRHVGHGEEEVIPLDLVAISRGEKPNLYLTPNDVVDVRQTAAKKVFLEFLDVFRGVFNVGYNLNP